jgi:DNA-directed RNA polymerase subunit RPC12/RpoP
MNIDGDFDYHRSNGSPSQLEIGAAHGINKQDHETMFQDHRHTKHGISAQDTDGDLLLNQNDMNEEDTFVDQAMFNMPGAFKPDLMDLDESPPFTIDLHYSVTDGFAQDHSFQNNVMFGTGNREPSQPVQEYSPIDSSSRLSTDISYPQNVATDEYHEHPGRLRNDSIDSYYAQTATGIMGSQSQFLSAYNTNPPTSQYHQHNSSINNVNSITNNLHSELSPITTTTSLTPSVNSMHSTQPSFFSANQYFSRNSLDQPPSSLHGVPFDVYNPRNSIDSQKPSRPGRFNTFSISNMIPFMSDRNQQEPISPPSPSSYLNLQQKQQAPIPQQPQAQSRGLLLRTIFKSTNPQNEANNLMDESDVSNGINREFMTMSPTKEEVEFDETMPSASKKLKKPKRSLFTRFKTPVKQEMDEKDGVFLENQGENDEFNANFNLNNDANVNNMEDDGNVDMCDFDGGNELLNGAISLNDNDALNTTFSSEQENITLEPTGANVLYQEPNYGALFENVGKRKNMVNRKQKIKVKSEPQSDGSIATSLANTERSSNHASNHASNYSKDSAASVHSSNASSLHHQISNGSTNHSIFDGSASPSTNATSTFASASKRILGSKLMSKKRVLSKDSTIKDNGVDVEVDLTSLDLPPDTQIFPTNIIHSKSRTRGRKENKQADMVDTSKIYLCNYCSRRFKRQEHLKRHFRSLHTFEKPYDCTICNKKFSRVDNLNQHLKIHKQEGISVTPDTANVEVEKETE